MNNMSFEAKQLLLGKKVLHFDEIDQNEVGNSINISAFGIEMYREDFNVIVIKKDEYTDIKKFVLGHYSKDELKDIKTRVNSIKVIEELLKAGGLIWEKI